jgi:hypothetical protein
MHSTQVAFQITNLLRTFHSRSQIQIDMDSLCCQLQMGPRIRRTGGGATVTGLPTFQMLSSTFSPSNLQRCLRQQCYRAQRQERQLSARKPGKPAHPQHVERWDTERLITLVCRYVLPVVAVVVGCRFLERRAKFVETKGALPRFPIAGTHHILVILTITALSVAFRSTFDRLSDHPF